MRITVPWIGGGGAVAAMFAVIARAAARAATTAGCCGISGRAACSTGSSRRRRLTAAELGGVSGAIRIDGLAVVSARDGGGRGGCRVLAVECHVDADTADADSQPLLSGTASLLA